jgi:hypothetical protein
MSLTTTDLLAVQRQMRSGDPAGDPGAYQKTSARPLPSKSPTRGA